MKALWAVFLFVVLALALALPAAAPPVSTYLIYTGAILGQVEPCG